MWKTEGLKQALDKYGFDAAFGGARRDDGAGDSAGAASSAGAWPCAKAGAIATLSARAASDPPRRSCTCTIELILSSHYYY